MDGFVERRRRRRRQAGRTQSVRFSLTETEMAELATAATRARLARGAFAATASMAAARGEAGEPPEGLRATLVELTRTADLVRRIGVNLNQAVRVLHATGEPAEDLTATAARCDRVVRNVDQVAELVRQRLP